MHESTRMSARVYAYINLWVSGQSSTYNDPIYSMLYYAMDNGLTYFSFYQKKYKRRFDCAGETQYSYHSLLYFLTQSNERKFLKESEGHSLRNTNHEEGWKQALRLFSLLTLFPRKKFWIFPHLERKKLRIVCVSVFAHVHFYIQWDKKKHFDFPEIF